MCAASRLGGDDGRPTYSIVVIVGGVCSVTRSTRYFAGGFSNTINREDKLLLSGFKTVAVSRYQASL